MSTDKGRPGRRRDDWDEEEEVQEEYYAPPVRRRRPVRSAPAARPRQYSPRQYPPPRQYQQPRRQRSVWPWLLMGCATGIVLLVLAATAVIFFTVRSATGGSVLPNIPIPGVGNPTSYTQKIPPQSISVANLQQIQVHDQIGNVTITVDASATTATITGVKKVKAANSDDANKEFNNIALQVQPAETASGTLAVSATIPDTGTLFSNHNDAIDVMITLPPQGAHTNAVATPTETSATATTTPTSSVTQVPLTLNVDTSIGKVTVDGVSGVLLIKDNIGDISVSQAVLSDGTHVQTGTGNVTFKGTVDLTPKDSNTAPRYKLQSETGTIDATLTGEPNIILDANTNSGTITSDFPISVKSSDGAASFMGPLIPSATTGTPQAVLTLNVSTGNVSLHKG